MQPVAAMITNGSISGNALFVIGFNVKDGQLRPFVKNASNGRFQPKADLVPIINSNWPGHAEKVGSGFSLSKKRAAVERIIQPLL